MSDFEVFGIPNRGGLLKMSAIRNEIDKLLDKIDRAFETAPLKLYRHLGRGVRTNSIVIVRAPDIWAACILIREVLDKIGLPHEDLEVHEHTDFDGVIYSNNGDY